MTELNRQSGENEERIIEIEIERLRPFKEHPFQVKDVLYRVTPVFEGSNLVASGVLMEAESVEDKAKVFCAAFTFIMFSRELTSIMQRVTARLLEQTRRQ